MSTRTFWYLTLGTVVLGLAASPAMAQNAGGDGDKGGTTGEMTTTPNDATDDAMGTQGPAPETGIAPAAGATDEPDCTATQRWDEQAVACVEK
jgi:hypothetical protein